MNPINISMPAAVVASMLAAMSGRTRSDRIKMPSVDEVRDTPEWRRARAAAKRMRRADKRSGEWVRRGWLGTRHWIVARLTVEGKPWSWNNPVYSEQQDKLTRNGGTRVPSRYFN